MWSGLQVVGGSESALAGFLSVSTLIRSGKGAGASALGWAASRVSGQQKACSGVWGTETQGSKQLLLWHEGPKGTPIRRVAQAARTWRWVCWRCGTPGGPVQGPGRLHSHLQEFSVTGGVWLNVSLCSFRWQLPCRSSGYRIDHSSTRVSSCPQRGSGGPVLMGKEAFEDHEVVHLWDCGLQVVVLVQELEQFR